MASPIVCGIDNYFDKAKVSVKPAIDPFHLEHKSEVSALHAEITRLNLENEELTEQLHMARARLANLAEHLIDREIGQHPVCDQAPD
jgi:hypothetical protein